FLGGRCQQVDRQTLHTRHGGDRFALVFALDDKHRPDEVGRRQRVLRNQPAGPIVPAEAPHAKLRVAPHAFSLMFLVRTLSRRSSRALLSCQFARACASLGPWTPMSDAKNAVFWDF